jgi:hypothetical protein
MTRKELIATLVSTAGMSQTATKLVFMGFPFRSSINMIGNDDFKELSDAESKEYVCMISFKNGKYYWTSRDNKEMSRNGSGNFVTFAALDGMGYVKFSPTMKDLPLDYMEHLHDKLFTITYWGKHSIYRE